MTHELTELNKDLEETITELSQQNNVDTEARKEKSEEKLLKTQIKTTQNIV